VKYKDKMLIAKKPTTPIVTPRQFGQTRILRQHKGGN